MKDAATERLHLPLLRPTKRSECASIPRPCPFVSCQYHLYLDVIKGRLRLNFPGLAPEDMDQLAYTCALDAAAEDGMGPEQIGTLMGVSTQRIHQLESGAMAKLATPALAEEVGVPAAVAKARSAELKARGNSTAEENARKKRKSMVAA